MRKATIVKHLTRLAALSLLLCLPRPTSAADPVHFDDANLKAAVEAVLSKTNPTPTDMLALTALDAYQENIGDLTGLEYAANLSHLDLSGNQISDLSPLAGLARLTELWLYDNQIEDLWPLTGLPDLTDLRLARNQISDLSPLAGLHDLRELGLAENQIGDISPLTGLTHLTWLDLLGNPLDGDACATHIPEILANNPGIDLLYDPCVDHYTLTISSTEGGDVIDPGEGSFLYDSGTVVPIEAVAETGSQFVGWTGTAVDAGKVADPNATSTTVLADDNYTVQADFASNRHTLILACKGAGTIRVTTAFTDQSWASADEGTFTFDRGTRVTIAAVPEPDWQFTSWTGTLGSGDDVLEFPLMSDLSLTANFARDPRTLVVTCDWGGSVVQPGVGSFLYERDSTVAVEASAETGHRFTGWTGTAVEQGYVADPARNRTTLVLTDNCTLHAGFEESVRQFHESWETAGLGTYTPSADAFFDADEGPWALGDGLSSSRTCGVTPNQAQILALDSGQALLLLSNDSNSECSDTVWVALDESAQTSEGALVIDANTIISFYELGELDAPALQGEGRNCQDPPCFDNVSVRVTDNRGNVLAYVLQRPDDAVVNVPNAYLGGTYREVFLDPLGIYHCRNLFSDFRTIPAFNPRDSMLSTVEIRVGEHGSAILDDVIIGPGDTKGTIPVYSFWSPVLESRLFTSQAEERQFLVDLYPDAWTFEGIGCFTSPEGSDPNLMPVYRFWSPVLLSHFYTIDEGERDYLVKEYAGIWTLEGIPFYAFAQDRPPARTVPTYRFWSPTLGRHIFTASEEEKADLIQSQSEVWTFEGVAWNAYPSSWDFTGAQKIIRDSAGRDSVE
jgi:hypothetical protein